MARIRIVCRGPRALNFHGAGGILCALQPSLADCSVFAVRDDGTEELLRDVVRVHWDSGDGRGPTRAVLRFAGVEVDVEGQTEEESGETDIESQPEGENEEAADG